MVEKLSPFGREWIMYGQNPGLKTQGLLDLEQNLPQFSARHRQSLMVLPGASLGTSIYRDVIKNLVRRDGMSPNWAEIPLTDNFETATREIYSLLPVAWPVAIRSSGSDECASGTYKTIFYTRLSDNPSRGLDSFQDSITRIYADFYNQYSRRKYFRGYQRVLQVNKELLDGSGIDGMGILIQPVVGNISLQDGRSFAPAISGVFTALDGEPYWKVVVGLGTRAVGTGKGVIEKGNKLLKTPPSFVTELEELRFMDALDVYGEVVETLTSVGIEPERFYPYEFVKLTSVANAWLSAYRFDKPYYWEFAIDPSYRKACILQSACLPPSVIKVFELSQPMGKVVYEIGKRDGDQNFEIDAVHIGKREGRGIVFVNISEGFNSRDLDSLGLIGNEHPGFLLLVPPEIFRSEYNLKLSSLKPVAGVVELRAKPARDPNSPNQRFLGSEAGAHFIASSEYEHLIFQAVTLKKYPDVFIEDLLGGPQKIYGRDVYFWERGFIIENAKTGIRLELLD